MLTGVSVVDVRTGTVVDDQTLVIRDGRIDSVGADVVPAIDALAEAGADASSADFSRAYTRPVR